MLPHGHGLAASGERRGPGEAAEFSAWIGEDRGRRMRGAFARAAIGLAIAAVIAFAVTHRPRIESDATFLCGCGQVSDNPPAGV